MFAYGDSFIYAGVDSKDYNVILCSFDGEDDNSGNFGLEREIISEDFNGRLKKTHYGAKYTAPLEFKITIVKNPCNNDRNYFIYDENRKRLIGENSNKVYKLGDKVKIRVVSANKLLRQIDFEIVEA